MRRKRQETKLRSTALTSTLSPLQGKGSGRVVVEREEVRAVERSLVSHRSHLILFRYSRSHHSFTISLFLFLVFSQGIIFGIDIHAIGSKLILIVLGRGRAVGDGRKGGEVAAASPSFPQSPASPLPCRLFSQDANQHPPERYFLKSC